MLSKRRQTQKLIAYDYIYMKVQKRKIYNDQKKKPEKQLPGAEDMCVEKIVWEQTQESFWSYVNILFVDCGVIQVYTFVKTIHTKHNIDAFLCKLLRVDF